MTGKQLLNKEYPSIIKNFDSDLYLQTHRKKELSNFESIISEETTDTKDDYLEKIGKDFFYNDSYQQLGENINVTEIVGHCVDKEFFINGFMKVLGKKSKAKFLGAIGNTKVKERFEKGRLNELKLLYPNEDLRLYQMWSFRNPGDDVLSGIKKQELSSLLALDDLTSPKFLFNHKIPSKISVYKPTAFDAGFGKYWKFGGYTNPRGKSKGKQGLEETVHNTIKIKDLENIENIPN